MLLLFVYQIGACPCGCVEHNAWLELLGFDHPHVTESTAGLSATDNHHDCTGANRFEYVSTTRQHLPEVHGNHAGLLKFVFSAVAAQSADGPPSVRTYQTSTCGPCATGLRTLAVMRI